MPTHFATRRAFCLGVRRGRFLVVVFFTAGPAALRLPLTSKAPRVGVEILVRVRGASPAANTTHGRPAPTTPGGASRRERGLHVAPMRCPCGARVVPGQVGGSQRTD